MHRHHASEAIAEAPNRFPFVSVRAVLNYESISYLGRRVGSGSRERKTGEVSASFANTRHHHIDKRVASTAAVKPTIGVTADVVTAYEASVDALISTVTATPNLNTLVRYGHPWFGPLNAAGWHAIAGIHMGIHRVQIERILAYFNTTRSEL